MAANRVIKLRRRLIRAPAQRGTEWIGGRNPLRSGRAQQKCFYLPPDRPLPNGQFWDSMGINGRQAHRATCAIICRVKARADADFHFQQAQPPSFEAKAELGECTKTPASAIVTAPRMDARGKLAYKGQRAETRLNSGLELRGSSCGSF